MEKEEQEVTTMVYMAVSKGGVQSKKKKNVENSTLGF